MSKKKAIFQQIISDFIDSPLNETLAREIEIPVNIPKIISIIGPRRSGKTHILFHIIQALRKSINPNRLVYVNFEDDRFFPAKLEDMDAFVQGYYELFPENKDELVYFFLDEVQEVENWEKFVRRIFDTENCRIYLTGSSSKLLSRELASTLRGRTIPYEVFPLNFSEFLKFNQIEANPNTSKGKALIQHSLRRYLKQGGFPELTFLPENLHGRVINEYIDLMLYRDLTERFSVKSPQLIKYLLKYLLNHLGSLLSVNKVYNDLKSQGFQVGKNTLYDYISHLEEAFIIFRTNIWSRSVRKQAINPSKIYAIDPAFKYAMSINEDTGRVFENAVFLEIRRRGIEPHYYYQKQEADFYWENGQVINACYEMHHPNTRNREINGLLEAMDFLELNEGLLLNWDEKEDLVFDNKKIRIRPLWEFLLNK